MNFISGNLVHVKNYIDDLLALLQTYEVEVPNSPTAVQVLAEDIDLEFLKADLPKLLNSVEFGAERIREISRSLKDFCRLDEREVQLIDIHVCINSTLLILQNRLKTGINVICHYGDVPPIPGYTGLLYQVFMNLLSNAIDAIEENYDTTYSANLGFDRSIHPGHVSSDEKLISPLVTSQEGHKSRDRTSESVTHIH